MNVEMMLKVADYIEMNPDHYDQNHWCGTTACIAGCTMMLNSDVRHSPYAWYLAYAHSPKVNNANYIPFRACEILGLTPEQAELLFNVGALWPEPFKLLDVKDRDGDFLADPQQHIKAAALIRHMVKEYQDAQVSVEQHDEELVLA